MYVDVDEFFLSIRSSPRDGLSSPYRLTNKGLVWDCSTMPCLHGRPTVDPSCTEFVYPGCWHFDNGDISKFDDVLLEHGGLPHVLPITPPELRFA